MSLMSKNTFTCPAENPPMLDSQLQLSCPSAATPSSKRSAIRSISTNDGIPPSSIISPKAVWRVQSQNKQKINATEQQKKIELYQQLEFSSKADWKKLKRPSRSASSKNKNSQFLFVDLSPKKTDTSAINNASLFTASSSKPFPPLHISTVRDAVSTTTKTHKQLINSTSTSVTMENTLRSPCVVKLRNDFMDTTPASSPMETHFASHSPKCVLQNGRAVLQPTFSSSSNKRVYSILEDERDCNDAKDAFAKMINRSSSAECSFNDGSLKTSTPFVEAKLSDENEAFVDRPLKHKVSSFVSNGTPTKKARGIANPKSKSYYGRASSPFVSEPSNLFQLQSSANKSFSSSEDDIVYETPARNVKPAFPSAAPTINHHGQQSSDADTSFTTMNIGSPIKFDASSENANTVVPDYLGSTNADAFENAEITFGGNFSNSVTNGLSTPAPSPVVASFQQSLQEEKDGAQDFQTHHYESSISLEKYKPEPLNFSDDFFQSHANTISLENFQQSESLEFVTMSANINDVELSNVDF